MTKPTKRKRAASPRRDANRARNRAERAAIRKKVAVATTLAATLHGVRAASTGGLMARAREYAPKATPIRDNWFRRLERTQPQSAAELLQLVADWLGGGEMRDMYPTLSALHRFVASEVTDISREQFERWVSNVKDES